MCKLRALLEQVLQLGGIGREPVLGSFSSNVDLKQCSQFLVALMGGTVQSLSKAHGIQRINCREELCGLVAFVRLQMSDQMPLCFLKIVDRKSTRLNSSHT